MRLFQSSGAALVCALAFYFSGGLAHACGPDSDCTIGERTYRIALPPGEGPFGAILYMHGYRGSAAGAMDNQAFRDLAAEMGVALIAAKSGGEDWLIRNAPRKGFRDDSRELEYFDALIADVTDRFAIDPDRILATGFSAGGMMTWTLACHRADSFAGFLPIAGTFWAPIPESCPNPPVKLIHINGTSDQIVPIGGRPIADTHQGDARQALALFREAGGYRPAELPFTAPDEFTCDASVSDGEELVSLCLHDGGHSVRAEWLKFGYETLVGPAPSASTQ